MYKMAPNMADPTSLNEKRPYLRLILSHMQNWVFLCSLDHLLRKNVIVFFFGNQISKWRSFEKKVIFDLLFTFFSHQGKVTKIPSAHISLTYIHLFCSPYWLFCLTNFEKNTNLSGMVSIWYESCMVLILIRAILEQSINNKMVSNI